MLSSMFNISMGSSLRWNDNLFQASSLRRNTHSLALDAFLSNA